MTDKEENEEGNLNIKRSELLLASARTLHHAALLIMLYSFIGTAVHNGAMSPVSVYSEEKGLCVANYRQDDGVNKQSELILPWVKMAVPIASFALTSSGLFVLFLAGSALFRSRALILYDKARFYYPWFGVLRLGTFPGLVQFALLFIVPSVAISVSNHLLLKTASYEPYDLIGETSSLIVLDIALAFVLIYLATDRRLMNYNISRIERKLEDLRRSREMWEKEGESIDMATIDVRIEKLEGRLRKIRRG